MKFMRIPKIMLVATLFCASIEAKAERIVLSCTTSGPSNLEPYTVVVDLSRNTVTDKGQEGQRVHIDDDEIVYFVHNIPNRDNTLWMNVINRWTGELRTYTADGHPTALFPVRCSRQSRNF